MALEFVMASSETEPFASRRRCHVVKDLVSESRSDLLLVNIEPPVIGQAFGLGGVDISQVVVAPRLDGRGFGDLETCWPVPVYVLLLGAPVSDGSTVHDEDLSLVAWAEVYPVEK